MHGLPVKLQNQKPISLSRTQKIEPLHRALQGSFRASSSVTFASFHCFNRASLDADQNQNLTFACIVRETVPYSPTLFVQKLTLVPLGISFLRLKS